MADERNTGDPDVAARRILIVDDEASVRMLLEQICEQDGFATDSAENVAQAKALLAPDRYSLLLVDKNLPDGTGMDILQAAATIDPELEAIMISAYATLDAAVEAMRLGVADFVFKPIDSIDDFAARVRRAVGATELKRSKKQLLDALHEKNRELEALSVRDPLTGLFNHAYLQESIESEIKRSQRNGLEVSLIFIDLDHFKEVNDSLGHQTGDKLLKVFAEVLLGGSRVYDLSFRVRSQDIPARYGGDEFALVLPETPKQGAAVKAERLRQAIHSVPWGEIGLPALSCSIGVAGYPNDANDRTQLIAAADAALYAAKSLGRDRLVCYSPDLGDEHTVGVTAEEEGQRQQALERSIDTSAVNFCYQPIVEIGGGTIIAYEAFARPSDAFFDSPEQLIRAAERAGRVLDLGRVLRQRSIAALERLPASVSLFVNLHPHELNDPSLRAADSVLLKWSDRIVFEIDQSVSSRNVQRVRDQIGGLRERGFRIAACHLAPDYNAIQSVAALDPDFIKVPRCLFVNAKDSARAKRLLRHLVEFAAEEDLSIIAEGIETAGEAATAEALGFAFAQGFHYGKPEPL